MSLNVNADILNIRNGAASPSASGNSTTQHIAANTTNNQTIDVGTPRHPTGFATATVKIHNFAQLPHKKGESTDSPSFSVHGLDWYLRIHPGGAASANGDGMVSLYLRCKSAAEQNFSVQAEFSLALRRNDGRVDSMMSCPCNAFRRKRKGWPNFIGRDRILDRNSQLLDENGTLTVVVNVQLFHERDANFVPRNELNLFRLLREANAPNNEEEEEEDGEKSSTANTADVKFSVEGEILRAHRLILQLAAPTLAHLCEDAGEDEAVPIPGVRSPIFQGVLGFAYGKDVPEEVWTARGNSTTNDTNGSNSNIHSNNNNGSSILSSPSMELLDAANRFGVTNLKILAETKVAEYEISIATASDLILYADAKNCPLLKERVVDYYVSHAKEVRAHPSFQKVKESASILDELMEAVLSKRILRSFSNSENDVEYDTMGVNLLRRKLDMRGLDVDGSREMLVQRLRDWDAKKCVDAMLKASSSGER
mmetsp:Transcript_4010/g.8900  ORF Transcript_4010/g.8900 Transcript_4010/m.8900 type:complete len:481 (-) Transcript_4010:188-1630(-)|eukprot:CAMPEP_0183730370 /NCGR_PEP_ID=MMETSP0737-20130205/32663_1 /TAXON_ID=385413 /ORGANISM="Thalassiosira miniscula, Strain CCMP1093" /LENGTH=480 /DNA_ID=CAMNT_0025962847 /DNA_START=339 /DNA_END=1781 /DNA_ORIENTATION=+